MDLLGKIEKLYSLRSPPVEAQRRSRHRGPVGMKYRTGACPVKRIVTTQTEWKEHHIGLV